MSEYDDVNSLRSAGLLSELFTFKETSTTDSIVITETYCSSVACAPTNNPKHSNSRKGVLVDTKPGYGGVNACPKCKSTNWIFEKTRRLARNQIP